MHNTVKLCSVWSSGRGGDLANAAVIVANRSGLKQRRQKREKGGGKERDEGEVRKLKIPQERWVVVRFT